MASHLTVSQRALISRYNRPYTPPGAWRCHGSWPSPEARWRTAASRRRPSAL